LFAQARKVIKMHRRDFACFKKSRKDNYRESESERDELTL